MCVCTPPPPSLYKPYEKGECCPKFQLDCYPINEAECCPRFNVCIFFDIEVKLKDDK
jgi:hypothetical protein